MDGSKNWLTVKGRRTLHLQSILCLRLPGHASGEARPYILSVV